MKQNLIDDPLLLRESQGDNELHSLIVNREEALDDFLEKRHSVIDERELLEAYGNWAFVVSAYKQWHGIEDPVHKLESED